MGYVSQHPHFIRIKIELVATDNEGKDHILGPELPELDVINPKEKIRYHYTFLRMFQNPQNETFRKSYIDALKNSISQKKTGNGEFLDSLASEFY